SLPGARARPCRWSCIRTSSGLTAPRSARSSICSSVWTSRSTRSKVGRCDGLDATSLASAATFWRWVRSDSGVVFRDNGGCRRFIDDQLKYVGPGIMAGHVEIELATADVVEIEGRGQNGFTLEAGAGQHFAEGTDDRAATPHQHRVGRVAEGHTN